MGGRRKSSIKPEVKRRPKLDVVFMCPFCSQEGARATISVGNPKKKDASSAEISCPSCKKRHVYSRQVSYLTQPIDVFSDWVDSLNPGEQRRRNSSSSSLPRSKKSRMEDDDDGEERYLPSKKVVATKKTAKVVSSDEDDDSDHGEAPRRRIVSDNEEEEF